MGKRIENWKCGAGMNVLRLSNISPAARLLYAILYGYKSKGSPHPFPSEETLAKDLGCKKRTVSRLKGDLKRAGLITWQSKPGGSNVYTIFDSPIDTAIKDSRDTDDQGCIVTSDTGVLSPVTTNQLMETI